jgi:phosphoribosylglycinamide formyltransferase-1
MVAQPLRAAILISGRGSNMERLISAQGRYEILGVGSDSSAAGGLAIARAAGIETFAVDRTDVAGVKISIDQQKDALWEWIAALNPELVLLAGYMQIVPARWIARFKQRILNIHPSLLPALPGLDTHRRAIEARVAQHGATVHLVDEGIDTGAIIAQAALSVGEAETEESLSARVLELEHRLYPWVVEMVASGGIALSPEVSCTAVARNLSKQHGFLLP